MFYSSILRSTYTLWFSSFRKSFQLCFLCCRIETHTHTHPNIAAAKKSFNFKWPIIDENYINFDEYKANSSFVLCTGRIESESHRALCWKTKMRDGERKDLCNFPYDGMPFIFLRQPTITLASRLNYEATSNINKLRSKRNTLCAWMGRKSHNITKFRIYIPNFYGSYLKLLQTHQPWCDGRNISDAFFGHFWFYKWKKTSFAALGSV